MLANIGLYSYGASMMAYALLAVLVFFTREKRALSLTLFAASALTSATRSAPTTDEERSSGSVGRTTSEMRSIPSSPSQLALKAMLANAKTRATASSGPGVESF